MNAWNLSAGGPGFGTWPKSVPPIGAASEAVTYRAFASLRES